MIYNAKDLSVDQRIAIESLLGRRVLENEAISVRAIEPMAISDDRRAEVLSGLEKYFERVDANRQPVTEQDASAVVDEALRSTRPQYQSIR
jgi:hypothetical protein